MRPGGATVRTIGQALETGAATLARAGILPARVEATLLLSYLLDTDRGGVLMRRREALDPPAAARFDRWVKRRSRRVPLQHVTGVQEFCGLELRSDGRALVPRPETEGLVEAALDIGLPHAGHVADLGTGSGCIAIALAVRRPDLRVTALDLSKQALTLARENARLHGVGRRVRFVRGDFRRPPRAWRGRMSLVVSNPPYVSQAEWRALECEVRDHDPRLALVAGPTGTEAYEALLPAAFALLAAGGHLVLELGWGQAERVVWLARGAGFREVDVRLDLRSVPRVLVGRKP